MYKVYKIYSSQVFSSDQISGFHNARERSTRINNRHPIVFTQPFLHDEKDTYRPLVGYPFRSEALAEDFSINEFQELCYGKSRDNFIKWTKLPLNGKPTCVLVFCDYP